MIYGKKRRTQPRAYLKDVAADVRRRSDARIPAENPPPHVGGYDSRTAEGGFTLIELLVVIAIIAILAAMLLPSLTRSKQQAWTTVCKNNLHETGLALQMYAEDAKEYPY